MVLQMLKNFYASMEVWGNFERNWKILYVIYRFIISPNAFAIYNKS